MMQETAAYGPRSGFSRDLQSGQSMIALLALVGTKRMRIEDLRRRVRLTPQALASLIEWLQMEYLVDVVSSLDGTGIEEKVELTEKGESVLISLLERTCELPELR